MKPAQQLRAEVLFQLYAHREPPIAVSAELLHRQLRRAGIECTLDAVRAELAFHVSAGHAAKVQDPVTGQEKFEITALGVTRQENE